MTDLRLNLCCTKYTTERGILLLRKWNAIAQKFVYVNAQAQTIRFTVASQAYSGLPQPTASANWLKSTMTLWWLTILPRIRHYAIRGPLLIYALYVLNDITSRSCFGEMISCNAIYFRQRCIKMSASVTGNCILPVADVCNDEPERLSW